MSTENSASSQPAKPSGEKTLTIRLPKPPKFSLQLLIMVLLIAVGILQTVQLFGLKKAVANAKVKPASSTSAPASSGGSGGSSQLPQMVGGC